MPDVAMWGRALTEMPRIDKQQWDFGVRRPHVSFSDIGIGYRQGNDGIRPFSDQSIYGSPL